MTTKLSEKEYKKLIIDISKNISPILVQQGENITTTAENIALYAEQITNAVNKVLSLQTTVKQK